MNWRDSVEKPCKRMRLFEEKVTEWGLHKASICMASFRRIFFTNLKFHLFSFLQLRMCLHESIMLVLSCLSFINFPLASLPKKGLCYPESSSYIFPRRLKFPEFLNKQRRNKGKNCKISIREAGFNRVWANLPHPTLSHSSH